MKKLLFFLIVTFSTNIFAIPEHYDTDIKQFIYNNLKNNNYRQEILKKMRTLAIYFSEKGNNYAYNKINLTIYYIEVFDIENLPEEQQKVILFFIKNV
jgi:hypothetical protein